MGETNLNVVGRSLVKPDSFAKVTGTMKYGDDINKYRQLFMATCYGKYPSAEIKGIDTSRARKLKGVADIITSMDIPGSNSLYGRFPVLADGQVRFIGEGIAAVAAETREIAEYAAGLIKIRYGKIFKPILGVGEALAEEARVIHKDKKDNYADNATYLQKRNNTEQGFAESDLVLSRSYTSGFVAHAYLEPEALTAEYDPNTETIIIQGTTQNPYTVRSYISSALGIPVNKVRVIQTAIGGSFGGKDEGVFLMSVRAALLAIRTGRPVKAVLSREESLLTSSKRHPYVSRYKAGLKKDGTIHAMESHLTAIAGPYNKQLQFVNWRACVHATGPYGIYHVSSRADGVYTNTLYGGAYRGFSAPQVVFGSECFIDECAEEAGMNPMDFRLRNCLRSGSVLPSGQIVDSRTVPDNLPGLIRAVCEKTEFMAKWQKYKENQKNCSRSLRRGIGLAATFRGAGLGAGGLEIGSARVTASINGTVQVQSFYTEMGQGLSTTLCQVVGEVLGLPLEKISWLETDTSASMDAGISSASRGLMVAGDAAKNGAEILRNRMAAVLAPYIECGADEIEFRDQEICGKNRRQKSMSFQDGARICLQNHGISLSAEGWSSRGQPLKFDPETNQGPVYPTYDLGAAVAEVAVDCVSGNITVEKITAAFELGKAVNPQIVRGQFIGGLVQGLGYAVMEEMDTRGGYLKTLNFDDLMVPASLDTPPVEVLLFESGSPMGPYGAKGIGEFGVEMAAPAIANAHANATGKRIRSLPLNLERVREAGHL
jgi:CO/xanthine dehydrogenase Mo-binding subunit